MRYMKYKYNINDVNEAVKIVMKNQKIKNTLRACIDTLAFIIGGMLFLLFINKMHLPFDKIYLLKYKFPNLRTCFKFKLIISLMVFFYPVYDFLDIVKMCGICQLKTNLNKKAMKVANVFSPIFRSLAACFLSIGLINATIETFCILIVMIIALLILVGVSFTDSDHSDFDVKRWLNKILNK